MSKEAMKLALDLATMHHTDEGYDELRSKVRVAAKEALAKQEQGEPWGACVSGRVFVGALPEHVRKLSEDEGLPIQWLYTTPQPVTESHKRKPLTDEQISDLWCKTSNTEFVTADTHVFAKAIEAAHGIKE
jgi:hypothetical protein